MKRLRLERWSGSFLPPRNPRLHCPFSVYTHTTSLAHRTRSDARQTERTVCNAQRRYLSGSRRLQQEEELLESPPIEKAARKSSSRAQTIPQSSLLPSRTQHNDSAKLAALHARLSLPARFPLQTLARCLIHPSADVRPEFNNTSLSILGQELLGYYTSEWLICKYPRLPMPILFAAQDAYVGSRTLGRMRQEWGVEAAAAPGEEVDTGLLQFQPKEAGNAMAPDQITRLKDAADIKPTGTGRPNERWHHRRGVSSRIVYDDQFGDVQSGLYPPSIQSDATTATVDATSTPSSQTFEHGVTLQDASATFIRALFGALYLHVGTAPVQSFHAAHILSRHLPLHTLFDFKHPARDLSRLCAREGWEGPVARLISETGRKSRTPVFVVGVFIGDEKVGEDAGASLNEARTRAAAQALRSWYLYSPPGDMLCLPSSTEKGSLAAKNGKRWTPQMVDWGEIVT